MAARSTRHDSFHGRSSRAARKLSTTAESSGLRQPSQLRGEETLAKMIATGRRLIEQHANFDLVLISDVIDTAGISTGAFYFRFKDKDAFIASVLNDTFSELQIEADQKIRDDASWSQGTESEIVARIVRYYVDMCRHNQGMFKAVLRHFASLEPDSNPLRWLARHIMDLAAPILAQKIKAQGKDCDETEVQIAIQMVVGTLTLILLTDPGPLHFDGDILEIKLTAMMQRFLQVT
jgi:AcrR family transcriptional regulator